MLATGPPETFMKQVGLTSTTAGPGRPPGPVPSRTSAVAARPRCAANRAPTRRASSSATIWPTLWRLPAYVGPGFPRPTTSQRFSLMDTILAHKRAAPDLSLIHISEPTRLG